MNNFEIVPVFPTINSITPVSAFHISCISIGGLYILTLFGVFLYHIPIS
jgi:hypothetical protein